MLSRIKSPFKKRSENSDLKYLLFTQPELYYYINHFNEENDGSDLDDASSTSLVSTNATMDNIPGTGRIIDKCVYQFFGRKVERFLFRISMANLSPDRILQFLWMGDLIVYPIYPMRLDSVIQEVKEKERIAGLKSLVKQTQSNSLYRSAAALSALTCLAASWYGYGDFYISVAAVEPTFHLESLANALDDSHPEKKYFLFLIGLARAQLHCVYDDCDAEFTEDCDTEFTEDCDAEFTEEFAINCRQKLLELLDSSRHDPLAVISDACLLFADVSSSFHNMTLRSDSLFVFVDSLTETAYYLLTFLVRFLIDQYQTINNMHPLQRLILFTYSCWLENVTNDILFCLTRHQSLPQVLPIRAFSILYRIIGNLQRGSFYYLPPNLIPLNVFPRRIRNSTPQEYYPIILQSSLRICTIRTRRLLASPDELRREARDSIRLTYASPSDGFYDQRPEEKSEEEWQRSLARARTVPVVGNDLTREFLEAQEIMAWDPTCLWRWKYYKELQQKRHGIGEYCRSNLDWDWDTSSSLKRLFRIDRQKNSSRPKGAVHQGAKGVPTIHRGINRGTLEVSIPEKAPNLLEKVVRIRYETEAGEVRYKMFHAEPSVEDVVSGAGADPKPRPSTTQETGSLTGESIEARSQVPEAVSGDEMKNTEVADEVHAEERWIRELNGASDTEDDSAFIDLNDTDRPQCNSRIEEWLETQVCVPMGD